MKNKKEQTILFDMDGTLFDFPEKLIEKIAHEHRLPEAFRQHLSDIKNLTSIALRELFDGTPKEQEAIKKIIWSLYQTKEFFASLEPYPNTVAMVQHLNTMYNVHICSRPSALPFGSEEVKVNTILKNYGASWRKKIILPHDKTMVRGNILVDDTHSVIKGKFTPEWELLMLDQPYNRQHDHPRITKEDVERWPHIISDLLAQQL